VIFAAIAKLETEPLPVAVTDTPLELVLLKVALEDTVAVGVILPLVFVAVATARVIGKYLVLLAAAKAVPAVIQPVVLILELPEPVKDK